MDDCTLEKLSVKPGKLGPVFNKNVTDYSVTVASNVENITLDLLTSDSGASYSIVVSLTVVSYRAGWPKMIATCIEA